MPTPEPTPSPTSRPGPIALVFRLLLGLIALALPLTAVWLLTALGLRLDLSLAVTLGLVVLVLVVLPLVWDISAEARFSRRANPPARILARWDRLRLRVLLVSVIAIGLPIMAWPRPTGEAIAKHGHWFLFNSQTQFAAEVHARMNVWAHQLVQWRQKQELGTAWNAPSPAAPMEQVADSERVRSPQELGAPEVEARKPHRALDVPEWPLKAEPHHVMRHFQGEVPSLEFVADHIRTAEPHNPFQRIKAIHDFVVHWVAYDTEALDPRYKPPAQDAQTVFQRRQGTCDGYVNLMVALGKLTGDEMTRIVGRSRVDGTGLDGFYHSWVGVTVDGKPYLIDPTWDAGSVFGREYRPSYSTSYLFTPPDIFAYDHLPNQADWSLTEPVLSEETFLMRPVLSAHFFARGMEMVGVSQAVTQVSDAIQFQIKNPKQSWVLVMALPLGDRSHGKPYNCVVPSQASLIEVNCAVTPGPWQVDIFANDQASGRFPKMGSLRVEAR